MLTNTHQLLIKPPSRGDDAYGSGHYGARRGDHLHRGIDLACYPGSIICALKSGVVTKIGYPYPLSNPKKAHFRYVQINDGAGNELRYFYVSPSVKKGDVIEAHQAIGLSQGFTKIYPGITHHIHFEVKRNGKTIDPIDILAGLA